MTAALFDLVIFGVVIEVKPQREIRATEFARERRERIGIRNPSPRGAVERNIA